MAHVLICEDDAFLAADLARSVEDAGHHVFGIYASSEAVLASDKASQADVAIIDLCLSDGETGTIVAQLLQRAGLRVIIISGHTNVNPGLCAIPHTYALKPVGPEVVRSLLGSETMPSG
jgi:ActR/RegA family two-component response regulator